MTNRAISLLLVAGIIVLINLLSRQFFFRWDVTEDQEYTLSKATKDILGDLNDIVTIKGYFSENLPPDLETYRTDFRDMLTEYAWRSGGNVEYEFVVPNENPEVEQEAMQSGIQPRLVNVREKDQFTQQKAYMGAVLSLGDQQEVIPFVGPGTPMEYSLTTAIKKMSAVDKPSVGFIQGHGEPGLSDIGQVFQALSVVFSVENIDLDAEESIPIRYRTVALIDPKDSIPPAHLAKLDAYLASGGKVIVAFDAVEGDFSTAQGSVTNSQLVPWLRSKGLNIEPSFLIDASCGSVTVQQRQGFFTVNTPVQFPFLPLVTQFPDHPVTQGLEQVIFQFASPLRYVGDSASFFSPIIESSGKSGTVSAPTYFNVADRRWSDADFPMSHIALGGVLESTFGGTATTRLVVFTDGDFPVSGGRAVNPDNVNLLVNAIEWLSDDTGLSALRTKGVTSRPIDDMEDGTKNLLRYLNFFLPIALALAYGLFRSQRSRAKRLRRMQERYV